MIGIFLTAFVIIVIVLLNVDWITHLQMNIGEAKGFKNVKYLSFSKIKEMVKAREWEDKEYSVGCNFHFNFGSYSIFNHVNKSKLHAGLIIFESQYYWTDPISFKVLAMWLKLNAKSLKRIKEKI